MKEGVNKSLNEEEVDAPLRFYPVSPVVRSRFSEKIRLRIPSLAAPNVARHYRGILQPRQGIAKCGLNEMINLWLQPFSSQICCAQTAYCIPPWLDRKQLQQFVGLNHHPKVNGQVRNKGNDQFLLGRPSIRPRTP